MSCNEKKRKTKRFFRVSCVACVFLHVIFVVAFFFVGCTTKRVTVWGELRLLTSAAAFLEMRSLLALLVTQYKYWQAAGCLDKTLSCRVGCRWTVRDSSFAHSGQKFLEWLQTPCHHCFLFTNLVCDGMDARRFLAGIILQNYLNKRVFFNWLSTYLQIHVQQTQNTKSKKKKVESVYNDDTH